MSPTSFDLTRDDASGIVTVTLNRPARLNALTFTVYEELTATFQHLSRDRTVRVVVLTGSGKAFCTGGDVHEIIGPLLERDYQGLLAFTRLTCALVASIRACPAPVIAALNGTVAGAGAVIAAACDVRVAAESARIAFLFTRVGLSGADMGAAWLLPRLVGFGRASELLLTGDFISAEEAHRIGLYNRVVPDADVMSTARAWAERLSKGPALALALTKDALNRESGMDWTAALESEAQTQAGLMLHDDFREAYNAFCARREPTFR
jgi:enoyl-CoA hydratase/carnithine racemase